MGIVDLFKGIALAVLVFLLVTSVPLFILMNTLQGTLFNADYYTAQFDKLDLWTQAQTAGTDLLLQQIKPSLSGTQQLGLNFTDAEIKTELKSAFTTDYLRAQVSSLLTRTFSYVKGETPTLSLTLSGVKTKLTTLAVNLLSKKTGLSGDMIGASVESEISKSVPEPLDLDKMVLQGKAKDQLAPVKDAYSIFALAMLIVPIAIIVIVILISLITFDVREVAKLVGWPLFVSILPLVLIAYIGPSTLMKSFYETLPSDGMGGKIPPGGTGSGPGALQQALPSADILRIVSGFLDPIFSSILTQAIIVLVIAIVLIALTFVLKKKEAKVKEKEKEEETKEKKKKK